MGIYFAGSFWNCNRIIKQHTCKKTLACYMIKFFGVIILLIFYTVGYSQDSLTLQRFLNGRVEIVVPQSLHEMNDEEWEYKYSNSKRKASLVLTDSLLATNVVIMHMAETKLSEDSISTIIELQSKKIEARFPTAKFLEKNTKEINGKKVAYFKVITPAEDDFVFNYLVVTTLEERALVLNFNCIESSMDRWRPVFDKIVESLTIHE